MCSPFNVAINGNLNEIRYSPIGMGHIFQRNFAHFSCLLNDKSMTATTHTKSIQRYQSVHTPTQKKTHWKEIAHITFTIVCAYSYENLWALLCVSFFFSFLFGSFANEKLTQCWNSTSLPISLALTHKNKHTHASPMNMVNGNAEMGKEFFRFSLIYLHYYLTLVICTFIYSDTSSNQLAHGWSIIWRKK